MKAGFSVTGKEKKSSAGVVVQAGGSSALALMASGAEGAECRRRLGRLEKVSSPAAAGLEVLVHGVRDYCTRHACVTGRERGLTERKFRGGTYAANSWSPRVGLVNTLNFAGIWVRLEATRDF